MPVKENPDRKKKMSSCQLVVPLSFFVNFEQITHLVLEFTLLTLNRLIPAGNILIFAFV